MRKAVWLVRTSVANQLCRTMRLADSAVDHGHRGDHVIMLMTKLMGVSRDAAKLIVLLLLMLNVMAQQ